MNERLAVSKKLLAQDSGGLISPLIDVVVNGFAAMFIILMVYMAAIQPNEPEKIRFLPFDIPLKISEGQNYIFTFPVTGGSGERQFTLTGTLPPDLKFNPENGTIYGIVKELPKASEISFDVQVTDNTGADNKTVLVSFEKGIIPYSTDKHPLQIVYQSKELAPGRIGSEHSFGIIGGIEPYNWKVVKGRIPLGLELVKTEGRLSGTPKKSGEFKFAVEVSHSPGKYSYDGKAYSWVSERVQKEYQIEIYDKPKYTTIFPFGQEGQSYSAVILPNEFLPTDKFIWEFSIPGLTAHKNTLSGIPQKSGEFDISYTIQDIADTVLFEGQDIIKISPAPATLRLNSTTFQAWEGEKFEYLIPYEGGISPIQIELLDSAPDGLTLEQNKLSGTPLSSGMIDIPIKLTDAANSTVTGKIKVRISPPRSKLRLLFEDTLKLVVGRKISRHLAVSGGELSYSFTLQGDLPSDLTFDNGGLTGILKEKGEWVIKIVVTDNITKEVVSKQVKIEGIYEFEQ